MCGSSSTRGQEKADEMRKREKRESAKQVPGHSRTQTIEGRTTRTPINQPTNVLVMLRGCENRRTFRLNLRVEEGPRKRGLSVVVVVVVVEQRRIDVLLPSLCHTTNTKR